MLRIVHEFKSGVYRISHLRKYLSIQLYFITPFGGVCGIAALADNSVMFKAYLSKIINFSTRLHDTTLLLIKI